MATLADIFFDVSSHVLTTALNAVAEDAAYEAERAANEYHTVHEITGKANNADVASYMVAKREGCLTLHGPIPKGHTKHATYNIVLHVPDSSKIFSLYRRNNMDDVANAFVLYKGTFALLVECDPSICKLEILEGIGNKLRSNQGWSAPHVAAALGLENCLRHRLMKYKLNDQDGELLQTPLQVAITNNSIKGVETLLELGVLLDTKDSNENNIFHLAAAALFPEIMRMLLVKVPSNQQSLMDQLNQDGCTAFHQACKYNRPQIIKELVNQPNLSISKDLNGCGFPLHWATGPESLIQLLELGCDPNQVDNTGCTALHHSVRRGCLKSALTLLSHGAFPDMKSGEESLTPLHIAAREGSTSLIQALIVFGADVNLANSYGDTARHMTCISPSPTKDKNLFIFHGVGALRCKEYKGGYCCEGCSSSGTFNGIMPKNFPNIFTTNLLHDAMGAVKTSKSDELEINSTTDTFNFDGSYAGNIPKDHANILLTKSMCIMTDPAANASDKANAKGRLLSLDGGGIRGLILTQMLMVMEQEFGDSIINMFDWIAGTSTGGILALALASGKSVTQTQGIYLRLKNKVFAGERPYSAATLEEFLKEEFGKNKTMQSIAKVKVMIMASKADRRPLDLHIFRNYSSPSEMIGKAEDFVGDQNNLQIWEVAKVTGAAPSYFRLEHAQFIDGGFIANNPTLDALTEIQQLFAASKISDKSGPSIHIPTTVVSLGTGIQPRKDSKISLIDVQWPSGIIDAFDKVPRLTSLISLLIDQATQSDGQVVERSRGWCSVAEVPFFRFSPEMSTFLDLDEQDDTKLVNMLWETRCYMIAHKADILDLKTLLNN